MYAQCCQWLAQNVFFMTCKYTYCIYTITIHLNTQQMLQYSAINERP